ncbi:MAG TPA: ribonuclease H-like domain-containing protein, partial [Anaerolineae bacterium]
MNQEIRDRLRRLGVHKGAGQPPPPAAHVNRFHEREEAPTRPALAASTPLDADAPLWNLELETSTGRACVRRTQFPLTHQHGDYELAHALSTTPNALQRLAGGAVSDLHSALFLDTETTGLAGGAGTLVFLIGVGYFEPDGHTFTVDQYFMPDPSEETGMLCGLEERLNQHAALVTFNGRGFDLPLLDTRYTISRLPVTLSDRANLDLLIPARRAWRAQLTSCSLGSLEYHMLNVQRTQQDIPGFLIPQMYLDYLRTGNPAEMQRVMYHNLYDILSMVTLVTRLSHAVSDPAGPGELISAGQYYESLGQPDKAHEAYLAALKADANPTSLLSRRAFYLLASSLKRQERRAEAVPYWQLLAEAGDLPAWIELAKYYEWHTVKLDQALACA